MNFFKSFVLISFVGISSFLISLDSWFQSYSDNRVLHKSIKKQKRSTLEVELHQSTIILENIRKFVNSTDQYLKDINLQISSKTNIKTIKEENRKKISEKLSSLEKEIAQEVIKLSRYTRTRRIKHSVIKDVEKAIDSHKELINQISKKTSSEKDNSLENKISELKKVLDGYVDSKQGILSKIRKHYQIYQSKLSLEKKVKKNLEMVNKNISSIDLSLKKLSEFQKNKQQELDILKLLQKNAYQELEKIKLEFQNS